MVSEKLVVVLLIIAIILSVVSVIVTISTVSMKLIPRPEIIYIQGNTEDSQQGKISIFIEPPEQAEPAESPEEK